MDVGYNARGDPNTHAVGMTYDKRRLLLTAGHALGFGLTDVFDP